MFRLIMNEKKSFLFRVDFVKYINSISNSFYIFDYILSNGIESINMEFLLMDLQGYLLVLREYFLQL